MPPRVLDPKLIEALKRFTTCDIGDALVKLKVPHGGYLAGLKMFSPEFSSGPAKICGPAHTVMMVAASKKMPHPPQQHFADTIPKGSVVFVSQPKGMISACWGGLMSTRAAQLGAAGVVVDGAFRDINEHRELNMGLFARRQSILGSNTFTKCARIRHSTSYILEGFRSNVASSKIEINPGDIIMGDADGVVTIALDKVEECIRLCQERADIDAKTMEALRAGEEMGPTIAKFRKEKESPVEKTTEVPS